MIDPRSLEVLYWTVQLGGFRRAAEKLHTTQPAVSARIAALEAWCGARLLDRDRRRRVTPTPRGTELLRYAERMMALQAELSAAFTDPASLRGTVRLGVAETVVHTWLNQLIRRLHDAYPHVSPDISVDVSPNLRAGLLGGELDVALLLGPVAAPGVRDLPLCSYPLAWVAKPGMAVGATLAELSAWPILTYPRGTGPHEHLLALLARHAPSLPVRPRVFANSSVSSIVRMVLDGIGVGLIAPAAIERELAEGALQLLDGSPPLPPLVFTASYADTPDGALAAAVARMAQDVASDNQGGS